MGLEPSLGYNDSPPKNNDVSILHFKIIFRHSIPLGTSGSFDYIRQGKNHSKVCLKDGPHSIGFSFRSQLWVHRYGFGYRKWITEKNDNQT